RSPRRRLCRPRRSCLRRPQRSKNVGREVTSGSSLRWRWAPWEPLDISSIRYWPIRDSIHNLAGRAPMTANFVTAMALLLLGGEAAGDVSSPALHCATPLALSHVRRGREMLRQEIGRPTFSGPEETVGSADGRFLFHFTRAGVDAVADHDDSP